MSGITLSLHFAPLLSSSFLWFLASIAAALIGVSLWRGARGSTWRALAIGILILALFNPAVIEEQRRPKPDTALIVVDQSTSNLIAGREQETEKIAAEVKERLSETDFLKWRLVTVADSSDEQGGTHLFAALRRALSDIPRQQLAGVIFITDGQVHDVPIGSEAILNGAPLHVLLTGNRKEIDRRLRIVRSPGFGLVNKQQTITVHIEDNSGEKGPTNLSIRHDGKDTQYQIVETNRDIDIPITLDHAGANIIEFKVDSIPNELSDENNQAVVTINGVRDRLRVLLVSGDPHPSTRVWRNFLKSDPSVDLVHFTILRPPEKQDSIPTDELSLIAFPVKELFEDKLTEFNLIIFDRYRHFNVLPNEYLQNIVNYVQNGGALLEVEGAKKDAPLTLFDTPVGTILPGIPLNKILQQGFRPDLTAEGKRHPVTADLPGALDTAQRRWGRWFRQIDSEVRSGTVLMRGIDQKPLLLLDRVNKGRVAQLFSDNIWLWSRGLDGGGPHAEFLRRLAHWLMKEPALEENDLRAEAVGRQIKITQRSLKPANLNILITKPGDETEQIQLKEEPDGRATGVYNAQKTGLYRISDGVRTVMVGVGGLNPLEYSDLRSSEDKLKNIVEQNHGGIYWAKEDGVPSIRYIDANRQMHGASWLGLRKNGDYDVLGIQQNPLMPPVLLLALAMLLLLATWLREGK